MEHTLLYKWVMVETSIIALFCVFVQNDMPSIPYQRIRRTLWKEHGYHFYPRLLLLSWY